MPGHYQFTLQTKKDLELVQVDRRYSDFELLRQALECSYPGLFIPCLPPKDRFITFQQEDSDSLKKRKQGIKQFLQIILSHDLISNEPCVKDFIEIRAQY